MSVKLKPSVGYSSTVVQRLLPKYQRATRVTCFLFITMKSETVVSFVSAQPGAIDCTPNLQSMVVPNNWPGVLIVFQAFQRMKDQFFKVSTDNFSLPLLALQRLDHFLLGKPAYC